MFEPSAIGAVADIVSWRARATPDAVAIRAGEATVMYADLDARATKVAAVLQKHGVGPGTRVAYCALSSETFFEVLFGALKAAAVFVPVNWRLSGEEIAAIVADSEATVMFVGAGYGDLQPLLHAQCPHLAHIIDLDSYAAWRAQDVPGRAPVATAPDDDVLQIYTSGTTGVPKGVVLTNANYMAVLHQSHAAGWADWTETDRVLVCMPLFHVGGMNVGLISLAHGATAVVTPRADIATILDAIDAEAITIAFLAPTLISSITSVSGITRARVASVRRIYYGAAPISETVLDAARQLFNAGFIQLYGLTETSGTIAYLSERAHEEGGARLRACGQPNAGVEIRVVTPDGDEAPTGDVGEIIARGASVMKGYWKKSRETGDAVRDGWLHTGDIGYFDAAGFLYIHDRLKDMIVSGGENVYPAEVENALAKHPAILEAAVIGVPDRHWGEAVKAVVVLRADACADAADIIAFVKGKIASYKAPRSVDFVTALPRSAVGKVLRRQLRERYWDTEGRRVN